MNFNKIFTMNVFGFHEHTLSFKKDECCHKIKEYSPFQIRN